MQRIAEQQTASVGKVAEDLSERMAVGFHRVDFVQMFLQPQTHHRQPGKPDIDFLQNQRTEGFHRRAGVTVCAEPNCYTVNPRMESLRQTKIQKLANRALHGVALEFELGALQNSDPRGDFSTPFEPSPGVRHGE
jgi:hypothetical protein